jgi:pyruvate dehydrogenase E2 component (dihydrolipoamide acetyltransferase)
MAEYARLPKIGLTMKTGTITNLFKNVGDEVKKGDVIANFETDKISGDIESPIDGIVLEVLIKTEEEIEVLKPIYLIGNPGEVTIDNETVIAPILTVVEPIHESVEVEDDSKELVGIDNDWVRAMPFARDFAKQNGIDLRTVKPSAKDGIIRKKDVEEAIASGKGQATSLAKKIASQNDIDLDTISGTGSRGKIVQADVLKTMPSVVDVKVVEKTIFVSNANRKKLSAMRKAIAERLSLSKRTIPHTYFKTEIDATSLIELKSTLKQENAKGTIQRITLTDILLKAIVVTLKKHPILYAQLDQDEIIYFDDINLGVAVSVTNGLVVPVIHGANRCSLTEIAKTTEMLVEKARNGNLMPEEYMGGNFTVSNLGNSEIDEFYAIINPPESAILAIGTIKEKVVVQNSEMVIRPMMTITLSVDHRLIDGAVAAEFMKELRNNIEHSYIAML